MYGTKKTWQDNIAPAFHDMSKNFKGSFEFRENDVVILSPIARQWDEVKTEGLVPNKEYVITSVTPMMPCAGGSQQFVSIADTETDLSYPNWCFVKVTKKMKY
jgi:hypothetical protein